MPKLKPWLAGPLVALTLAIGPLAMPASAATARQYTVKSGDSLSRVAQRLGVSVTALLRANGLKLSSVIHPGQVLTVPQAPKPFIFVPGQLPGDLQTAEKKALIPLYKAAAAEFGVPADLLMSLSYVESSWNQSARSPDKAIGLGQLLPATAKWVASELMREPKLDARIAKDNVRMTARYMRYLLAKFPGNGQRALAAYFEGEGLVQKKGPSASGLAYANRILSWRVMFSKVA